MPVPLLHGVELGPRTAPEAYVAVATVAARLAEARHPYAPFAAIYARVTLRVATAVDARAFEDPVWVSGLAGRFAELYLEALYDALAGRIPRLEAWARAFTAAREAPPAFAALLGVNAHINGDLGLALATARWPSTLLDDARHERDHERVNVILTELVPELLDLLTGEFRCRLAAWAGGPPRHLFTWATMLVIRRWRARAWRDATALIHTSQRGRAWRLLTMDQRASRLARLIRAASAPWPRAIIVSATR